MTPVANIRVDISGELRISSSSRFTLVTPCGSVGSLLDSLTKVLSSSLLSDRASAVLVAATAKSRVLKDSSCESVFKLDDSEVGISDSVIVEGV